MSIDVYVSSTYTDLRAHRAAVNETIRRLGHTDVSMEHYVAGPERPLTRCLADVRRADLYVLLLARRYGYVPPGADQSITEQEFRTAQRAGKDVLCFMLSDDAEWPAEHVEEGEGAARLARLKAEVGERYLAGFFESEPWELASLVAVSIARTLDPDPTPHDPRREQKLIEEWRRGATRRDRARARQALANMGSPRYAAALQEQLRATDDPEAIARTMEDLLRVASNGRDAMWLFVDLLGDTSGERRFNAVFHLGELGLRGVEIPEMAVRALLDLQDDPEPYVRSEAAHSLGKIVQHPAVAADVEACLRRMSEDPDGRVRQRAQQSLVDLGLA